MRRMSRKAVACLAAATALTAGGGLADSPPILLWDKPAIKVFPDHDAAAADPGRVSAMIEDGRRLFSTKFNRLDGAGRPESTGDSKPTPRRAAQSAGFTRLAGPDANSCSGCHNDPIVGGAGDFATNVFVGAHLSNPPIVTIDPALTNERNTVSIEGAGAVEGLAREMTATLKGLRDIALGRSRETGTAVEVPLEAKGVSFGSLRVREDGTLDMKGVTGVDDDLVVKPFGAKGVAVSIREFTLFALNQHHGIQAVERFGWQRTGVRDFDNDGVEVEMSIGQVSALALFQAGLAAPLVPDLSAQERHGAELFDSVGCASCHVPELLLDDPLFVEPNPFNRPGAAAPDDVAGPITVALPVDGGRAATTMRDDGRVAVRLYSDLKRHVICDAEIDQLCNERIRQDSVPTDQFMTKRLWNLATSAPYCHRGDCTTLSEAILAHGGEARESRALFLALEDSAKLALVAFLASLGRE